MTGKRDAGGLPTTTSTCATSLPARNVSVATPSAPVTIFTAAARLPGGTLTVPFTDATAGSDDVTVIGVAAAPALDNTVRLTDDCPPIGVNSVPRLCCCSTVTPTGLATTGGAASAAGGPTTIVSSRVSVPARKVSVAVPAAPVTIATVA